ncbi:hypothetical protein [Pelagicoccus mobilis]|uniref:Glycosyltransferase RgtA/B/C/D-like domain-containing protein n=1 Tax=Pelagicoccus mobilis TaxID=415221 RepID=A0A934RXL2_9BACT|nr:hypothetical protein [Pelagicoccus mobilis]MBK1878188.1 hypothetical protein [Pelagicoccus mobilis]
MKTLLPYFLASTLFLALLLGKHHADSGFSELAGFGEDYHRPKIEAAAALSIYHKPNSTGYDGQFYTQIALDPTLRDPGFPEAIDHPSYRARRILQPALAWLFGAGHPAAILQAHSLINVACLAICGWLLLLWIPIGNWENFARWFLCVFSMGALESVRYSLADLPALTLALATIAFLEKGRGKLAVTSNALAALSKETSLINAVVFLSPGQKPSAPFRQRLGQGILAGAIATASLAAWMAYVSYVFPVTLNANDNIGLPFSGLYRGIVDAFQQLAANGFSDRYFFRILAIFGLLFQFGYLLAKPQLKSRLWALGIVYGILFLTLGDAVWRGYWAGCRIALPLSIAFNILYSPKSKTLLWSGLFLSNLAFVHAIIRWL